MPSAVMPRQFIVRNRINAVTELKLYSIVDNPTLIKRMVISCKSDELFRKFAMPCGGGFYFNTNQPIAGLAQQINIAAIAVPK